MFEAHALKYKLLQIMHGDIDSYCYRCFTNATTCMKQMFPHKVFSLC